MSQENPTWAMVVDPKQPGKSVILYNGQPLADVLEASVALEPVATGSGKMTTAAVLTVKLVTSSLGLATYSAEPAPAQAELPLNKE